MKKRIGSLLLVLVLAVTLVTPVFASTFDVEDFCSKNEEALDAKGVGVYGCHRFRSGLMPVIGYRTDSDGYQTSYFCYINENLEIVDLNNDRFTCMFPFFEGLAAVIDKNDKIGYINTKGEIVIPCQYDVTGLMGETYAGYFYNGVATVIKRVQDDKNELGFYYMSGKIDKNGNLVEDYKNIGTDLYNEKLLADSGRIPVLTATENELDEGLANTPAGDPSMPSMWAREEINVAGNTGLLTEHTSSGYTKSITRYQFAELVVNMVEKFMGKSIETAPETTFTDCKETAVLKAYKAGIVNGMSDTTYEPNSLLTREQLAAMLYRANTYLAKNGGAYLSSRTGGIEAFADKNQISDWAQNSLDVMVTAGIIKGTSDTTISPKANCTVEQGILLTYREYKSI